MTDVKHNLIGELTPAGYSSGCWRVVLWPEPTKANPIALIVSAGPAYVQQQLTPDEAEKLAGLLTEAAAQWRALADPVGVGAGG